MLKITKLLYAFCVFVLISGCSFGANSHKDFYKMWNDEQNVIINDAYSGLVGAYPEFRNSDSTMSIPHIFFDPNCSYKSVIIVELLFINKDVLFGSAKLTIYMNKNNGKWIVKNIGISDIVIFQKPTIPYIFL